MRSERIDPNTEAEAVLDKGPLVYNDEGDIISGGVDDSSGDRQEDDDEMSDDGTAQSCEEVVSDFRNAMGMFSE